MIDYCTVSCQDCGLIQFPEYVDDPCEFIKGTIHAVAFTTCGTSIDCVQNLEEVQALIASRNLVVMRGLGTKGDPTENSGENPFPCGPSKIINDYTETLSFETNFSRKENYDLFNEIRKNNTLGELYYAIKDGLIFKAIGTPTVAVKWTQQTIGDDDIWTATLDFEYETTDLDKPYCALGPIFGCTPFVAA